MKINNKRAYDYSKLKRRIFARGLLITAFATLAVLLFRWLSYGRLANAVVEWIGHIFKADYNRALYIYQKMIPNNLEAIIGIVHNHIHAVPISYAAGFFYGLLR